MFLTKLRIGLVVLAAALLGGAAGLSALSRVAAAPEAKPPRPAMRDGVTVKDLTDMSAAAQKALEGTWELQKTVIDDNEQEFQFEYNRHTFAERTVKIEYKLKRDGQKFEGESSFTVNPTTKPPEITIYSKNFLVMGIYELDGDKLRIAFHGISELERPRGFAVADKRVADLPLCVWEFKRKAPEKPPPARPPAAKAAEPAWKAEFDKVYGLKDGEVLKRVAPPYSGSREEFYTSIRGEPREDQPHDRNFSVFHWKGGRVQFGSATTPVNPDEGMPLAGLLGHLSFPRQEVEGDDALLDTTITGDFVLRPGADPAKVAARLGGILRKDCNLAVALAIREVEREVVVARGKYRSKPLPGKDSNHIELYATELQRPEAGNGGGSAAFSKFLCADLGGFINRRLVNEVEGAPKHVSFHYSFRSLMVKDPTTGVDTYAEDTDPEKVLKNVAAQTGLTFTTEKRNVPVLFVEKAGK
jgi:uncharacterized protein (TIGR03067 family)